jgi:hypothetical protein
MLASVYTSVRNASPAESRECENFYWAMSLLGKKGHLKADLFISKGHPSKR